MDSFINPFTLGRQALAIPEGFRQGGGTGNLAGGVSGALQAFQNPQPFEQDQRIRMLQEGARPQIDAIMSQAESAESADQLGQAMGQFQRLQMELVKQGVSSPDEFQLILGPAQTRINQSIGRVVGLGGTPEEMERRRVTLGAKEGGGRLSEIMSRSEFDKTSTARRGLIEEQTKTEKELRPEIKALRAAQAGSATALSDWRASGGARGQARTGTKPIDFQRALGAAQKFLADQTDPMNMNRPDPAEVPLLMAPVLNELNRMAESQGITSRFDAVPRGDGFMIAEVPGSQGPGPKPEPHPSTAGRQAMPPAEAAAPPAPSGAQAPAAVQAPRDQIGGTASTAPSTTLPAGWEERALAGELPKSGIYQWYLEQFRGDDRAARQATELKWRELQAREQAGAQPAATPNAPR